MLKSSSSLQTSSINIWQSAVVQKQSSPNLSSQQKTVILVGNNSSGKSSLLKTLKTDTPSQPKPTILFQYSYIKNHSQNKQIIHCYQLSNQSQLDIVNSIINKDCYEKTKVVICVDLSKPIAMIQQLNFWIDNVKKQLDILKNEKSGIQDKINQYLNQTHLLLEDHQDKALIKPLPIQTLIIGCKYDEFQKQDSENRKWYTRAIRYLAHINHCHLYFTSNKNQTIISQTRSIFNQILFSGKRTFYNQKDHLKPIFISKGQDSIQSLNIINSSSLKVNEIIKKQYISIFGTQQDNEKKQNNQIDLMKYHQNRIDTLIQDRKKEILKIMKIANKDKLNNKYT